MKYLVFVLFLGIGFTAGAQHEHPKMQHGFILVKGNTFASHLVANGHHSYQVNISVELNIPDRDEELYLAERQKKNSGLQTSYFLFQAQELDLPNLKKGQVLEGHIIESEIGKYQPRNEIVSEAVLTVQEVHINIVNPFFKGNNH